MQCDCQTSKMPFTEGEPLKSDSSFVEMTQWILCPHFRIVSFTTLLIAITFFCLIVPQFLFTSYNKYKFLSYTDLEHVYLASWEVKSQHKYIYETMTALFFHSNFSHWIGNVMVMLMFMSEMEFCSLINIPIMLVCGIVTNCFVVIMMDVVTMGSSGMLAASIGIFIGYFISNGLYICENYSRLMIAFMVKIFFAIFMLINGDPRSTGIHFIGLGLGICFSVAWTPKLTQINSQVIYYCGWISKGLSVLLTILPIALILANAT